MVKKVSFRKSIAHHKVLRCARQLPLFSFRTKCPWSAGRLCTAF